jgi:hypothetical protein
MLPDPPGIGVVVTEQQLGRALGDQVHRWHLRMPRENFGRTNTTWFWFLRLRFP